MMTLWIFFFWRILTPNLNDRLTFLLNGDFTLQFLAYRQLGFHQLAQGLMPFVEECIYSGHPFLADPQSQILYPPVLAIMTLGRILHWVEYPLRALEWEVMVHVLFSGISLFAFLRRAFNLGKPSALFGACGFMFGGFINGYATLQTGILETAAWLPMLLLALHGLATTKRWFPAACATGLILACAFLAGHPQTLLFELYVGGAAFVFWTFGLSSKPTGLRLPVTKIIIAGLLTIGLSAPQLIPELAFAQASTRAAISYAEASNGFQLSDLWMFLLNDNFTFWQPLYVGIATLTLAVIGVSLRWRHVWLWVAIGGIALLLSYGANAIFYDVAFWVAPGFAQFRSQERAAFIISFALCIVAAVGLDAVVQPLSERSRELCRAFGLRLLEWSVVVLAGTIAMRIYLAATHADLLQLANRLAILFMGMALCGGLLLWRGHKQGLPAGWTVLILVVLLGDLFSVTRLTITQPFANPFPHQALLDVISDKSARINNQNALDLNVACVNGYREVGGGSPISLKTYATFLARAPEDVLTKVLNVRHTLTWRQNMTTPEGRAIPYKQLSADDPDKPSRRTYELLWQPDMVGEAWIVPEVTSVGSEDALYDALRSEKFDPFGEAFTYGALTINAAATRTIATKYQAGVEGTSAGYLKVAAFSNAPALLVISRAYYANWIAIVNGVELRPILTDGALIGVPIPSGQSTIELSFRPTDFYVGLAILALTVVCAMIGLVVFQRSPPVGSPDRDTKTIVP